LMRLWRHFRFLLRLNRDLSPAPDLAVLVDG
jgi:hypothetical protein